MIGITMGDPVGVGPEITLRSIESMSRDDRAQTGVFGNTETLCHVAGLIGSPLKPGEDFAVTDLPVEGGPLPMDKLDKRAGEAAFRFIEAAVRAAEADRIGCIVTGPINKEALNAAGHHYYGHTGMLSSLTGQKGTFMLLASERLKVIHAATHVSLKTAIERTSPERIRDTIHAGHSHLQRIGIKSPRIAVDSPHMRADLAVLDPELTFSVPPAVTAATGVDAMAHCVEALTSLRAHDMIDGYARTGISLGVRYLRRAAENGHDAEAYNGMMLASYYGGICLDPVNTAAGHALAYPLGTRLHLPHGLANAIIFPHVLAFNAPARPEKTAEVMSALGLEATPDSDKVAKRTYDFCASLGIEMQLSRHGVPQDSLTGWAKEAHAIRRLMDNNPRDMSVDDMRNIYAAAF